jgi:hypothetical protein
MDVAQRLQLRGQFRFRSSFDGIPYCFLSETGGRMLSDFVGNGEPHRRIPDASLAFGKGVDVANQIGADHAGLRFSRRVMAFDTSQLYGL